MYLPSGYTEEIKHSDNQMRSMIFNWILDGKSKTSYRNYWNHWKKSDYESYVDNIVSMLNFLSVIMTLLMGKRVSLFLVDISYIFKSEVS